MRRALSCEGCQAVAERFGPGEPVAWPPGSADRQGRQVGRGLQSLRLAVAVSPDVPRVVYEISDDGSPGEAYDSPQIVSMTWMTVTALNSRCSVSVYPPPVAVPGRQRRRTSVLEIAEPAQGAQPGHEAVLAAARDDEPRKCLQAPPYRPPGDGEVTGAVVGPDDGGPCLAGAEEDAVVHPFGLDELELQP